MSSKRLSEFYQYAPRLKINLAECAVLHELARRENEETGLCSPSLTNVAWYIHANTRTVLRGIHSLERKGILVIKKRKDETNRTLSNSYSFNLKNPIPLTTKTDTDRKSMSATDRKSPHHTDRESSSPSLTESHGDNRTHSNDNGELNNQQPITTTPNPIQPHSPRAHAKDGIGLGGGGGVCRGATPRSKRTAGDMPILSSLDTNGMPKGYPDEEKYLAFIESLLTDEGQNWRRSVLMEGRKSFQRICDRGWQDKDGGFIGNWRRYARGCIAKEFEEAAHRILNWDDALISIADVEPPSVVGLKPCIRPSKPAEQPQNPLPPPTEERKPDLKPPSPVDTPSVEHPPTAKPKVKKGLVITDPAMRLSMELSRIKREREEASRHKRVIAASTGHAEGVYYRGNG